MAQTQKVGTLATSVYVDEYENTHVVYHSTKVVSFNDEIIILRSGGWETVTTKLRMNQASNEFDLGYNVFQCNFEWFVNHKDILHVFKDGMTLHR